MLSSLEINGSIDWTFERLLLLGSAFFAWHFFCGTTLFEADNYSHLLNTKEQMLTRPRDDLVKGKELFGLQTALYFAVLIVVLILLRYVARVLIYLLTPLFCDLELMVWASHYGQDVISHLKGIELSLLLNSGYFFVVYGPTLLFVGVLHLFTQQAVSDYHLLQEKWRRIRNK